MSKKITTSSLFKLMIVLVVVAVWGWGGWTAYRSFSLCRQPNPELISTFRVIFQPERINQAAGILSEKAAIIGGLPEVVETPVETEIEGEEG